MPSNGKDARTSDRDKNRTSNIGSDKQDIQDVANSSFDGPNSQTNEASIVTVPVVREEDITAPEPEASAPALKPPVNSGATPPLSAASLLFESGDVFIGVGSAAAGDPTFGEYRVYDNSGVFKESITASLTGQTAGCAFNPAGDKLYTTYFFQNRVVVFDANPPHDVLDSIDTTAHGDANPESVVFAANGDFYVGNAGGVPVGDEAVQIYDADGTFLRRFIVAVENRGSDWITLAADQRTLFYTSERGQRILRYDVVADLQLPDFAVLPSPSTMSAGAFALRLLPPGDGSGGLLVANTHNIVRLDGSGAVIQTYDAPEDLFGWFALSLDPNGTSFWAGTEGFLENARVYRFNIETGVIEVGPIEVERPLFVGGICVRGEPLFVSTPGEITLDPPTAENAPGTPHTVTATVKAGETPLEDTLVRFEVTAGPNLGEVSDLDECTPNADCTTDASGRVSWTYTSNVALGTDTIQACFTDATGMEHCTTAKKNWVDRTPPTVACVETVNPHGKNVPPAGQSSPGQNEDGFYEFIASDDVDDNVGIFAADLGSGVLFGPFPTGAKIKYTEANGTEPDQKKIGSENGQAGAIDWHITGNGDLSVFAVDASGNESIHVSCLVPPTPK